MWTKLENAVDQSSNCGYKNNLLFFIFSTDTKRSTHTCTLQKKKKKKGGKEKRITQSWVFLLVCLLCFPCRPRTHCFSFFLSWTTTRVRVGVHASLWQIEGQLPFPRGSVKSFPHDLQGRVVGELQVVDAGHDGGQEVVRVLPGLKRLAHDGQGWGQAAETWNMQLVMQSLHQKQSCFSSLSLQLTLCCPPPPTPPPTLCFSPTVPLPCLALCCFQLFLSPPPPPPPPFALCCSQLFLAITQCGQGYLTTHRKSMKLHINNNRKSMKLPNNNRKSMKLPNNNRKSMKLPNNNRKSMKLPNNNRKSTILWLPLYYNLHTRTASNLTSDR